MESDNQHPRITRLDCEIFRGSAVKGEGSGYTVLSPRDEPGTVVAAIVSSIEERISAQVASRLALTHFVESTLDLFEERSLLAQPAEVADQLNFDFDTPEDFASKLLEQAIAQANAAVYQFGHKLAAGGSLATGISALLVRSGRAAAARIGQGGAYLVRNGSLFRFFESENEELPTAPSARLGAAAEVEVELSAVPLEAGDRVLLLPELLGSFGYEQLRRLVSDTSSNVPLENILQKLYAAVDKIPGAISVRLGPRGIYLNRYVVNPQEQRRGA